MRHLEIKDMKIIVDDFHEKVEGQFQQAKDLLIDAITGVLPESSRTGDCFNMGRFECSFNYRERDNFRGDPRGVFVVFRDIKGIMTDFHKPLYDFLYFYANPNGYFALEAVAFQLQ